MLVRLNIAATSPENSAWLKDMRQFRSVLISSQVEDRWWPSGDERTSPVRLQLQQLLRATSAPSLSVSHLRLSVVTSVCTKRLINTKPDTVRLLIGSSRLGEVSRHPSNQIYALICSASLLRLLRRSPRHQTQKHTSVVKWPQRRDSYCCMLCCAGVDCQTSHRHTSDADVDQPTSALHFQTPECASLSSNSTYSICYGFVVDLRVYTGTG